MTHRVLFSRRSEADLVSLYDYIAKQSDPSRAFTYVERIGEFCFALHTFPQRGASWDRVSRGVRVVGFERRVSIAFRVIGDTVTILRVYVRRSGRRYDSESE